MKADKVMSMLGIAAKAGGIVSGEFSTEKAIKDGKAYLVIVACDASVNTQKRFCDMAMFRGIPIYRYGDKENLGHFVGKEFRASLAVTNEQLARSIEDRLKMITTE